MARHFSDLMQTLNLQIHEVPHSPITKSLKKFKQTHIKSSCSKAVKKRKSLQHRQKTCHLQNKEKSIDLLLERTQVRREWSNIFKVKKKIYHPRILYLNERVIYQKEKSLCQPRILCPTKLSFKIEGAIKTYKTDSIHPQQTHIIRNVACSPLGRRNLT